ncbi:MAG: spoIIR [Evtepia sp.]|nr:spoIIR [Evtepia sp.]
MDCRYGKVLHVPWRQLIGLFCIALVGLCFWLDSEQNELAEKMLRLHVLANSDSEEDQALKLRVRDQVLTVVEPWLESKPNVTAVEETLRERAPELQQQAETVIREAGYDYPVTVSVENTWFPTRQYDGFSLPAGSYESLRVIIGEGKGHNWWCVVFPPLCLAATTESVSQSAEEAGLTEEDVMLILEDDDEYVIKFKAIELWEQLKHTLDQG